MDFNQDVFFGRCDERRLLKYDEIFKKIGVAA